MTDAEREPPLSPAEARALAAVLDALVPPSADGRLPGAGALGLAQRVEDAMAGSPALAAAVRSGLAALEALARGHGAAGLDALAPAPCEALLRELAAREPGFVPGLLFHTYAGYYQHPEVLAGLGLEPRPPFPKGYAVEPSDLDALLAPVRRRAPLYRA
jgi:Gluconate 2-dehydrogenase subunit 3